MRLRPSVLALLQSIRLVPHRHSYKQCLDRQEGQANPMASIELPGHRLRRKCESNDMILSWFPAGKPTIEHVVCMSLIGTRKMQVAAKILIEEYRLRHSKNGGYSMRAFARDLDIDSSTLVKIVSGRRKIGVSIVRQMYLNMPLSAATKNDLIAELLAIPTDVVSNGSVC